MRRAWPHAILLLGLGVRLALAPHVGHRGDEWTFVQWIAALLRAGPAHLYDASNCNYLPLWCWWLWLIGHLGLALGRPPVFGDVYYRVALKAPQILADVALFYLLWGRWLRHMPARRQALWSVFVAFNPALILVSAVWCQVDAMVAVFLVAAFVAYDVRRPVLALLMLMLSLWVKPWAIVAVPFLLVAVGRQFGLRALLGGCLAALVGATILTLPFHRGPWLVVQLVVDTAGRFGYSSVDAFNVWGLTGYWLSDERLLMGLPHSAWGAMLLTLALLPLLGLAWRDPSTRGMMAAVSLAELAWFLFPTRIQERYIYLPAVCVLAWAAAESFVLWYSIILTITAALNVHFRMRIPGDRWPLMASLGWLHNHRLTLVFCLAANLGVFMALLGRTWRRSTRGAAAQPDSGSDVTATARDAGGNSL